MDYERIDIEAYIHRARKLRSDALADLISSGMTRAGRFAAAIFKRIGHALHTGHLVHH